MTCCISSYSVVITVVIAGQTGVEKLDEHVNYHTVFPFLLGRSV